LPTDKPTDEAPSPHLDWGQGQKFLTFGYPRNPHPDTVDLVTKYNEERGLPFRYKKLEFGFLVGMKI